MAGPARAGPARLAGALAYHQALLSDARRNRAFARALEARVRPGCRVLDLGAGSGVWSVLAARLGARQVLAVEREAALGPVIEALARENGVAARVRVVRADARQLRPAGRFDVIVCELVGNEAFDEGIVPILARARSWLRPGGALVPEWLALEAAPVRSPCPLGVGPAGLLQSASFAALAAHAPRSLRAGELRALAPGRELLRVELRRALPRRLPPGRASFPVADGRAVGGVAVWVRLGLAPGVTLRTRSGTHWLPSYLPLDPLPAGRGRLELELDGWTATRRWSARFVRRGGAPAEVVHSPLFAWGALRPALR